MLENQSTGKANKDYQKASLFLKGVDSDWDSLVTRVGKCNIKISSDLLPWQSMIKSIIFQQLSPAAASSIYKQFLFFFGNKFPNADLLLNSNHMEIKTCGLSLNKLNTIIKISEMSCTGDFPSWEELQKMTEEEIINRLIIIKGVGEWTIKMLMIFNLGFINIMPSTDLAIKNNYQKLKKLKKPLTAQKLSLIAEDWHPYKSVASWYLWRL
jgi:DNA-3-methyladenine glycosylase II